MATTSIEWTDRSWNFLAGCSLASPGCTNCYAQRQAARIERMNPALDHYRGLTKPSKAGPVWTGKIGFAEHKLLEPLSVKKPAKWFVNSMSDLFHEDVPDEIIDRAFAEMGLANWHVYQILTKRSDRMKHYVTELRDSGRWLLLEAHCGPVFDPLSATFEKAFAHLWLGVSVEDQRRADERIPDLLATPAAIRWISAEPLLGPVDLTGYLWGRASGNTCPDCPRDCDCECGALPRHMLGEEPDLAWIVVGGESGPNARVWPGFDDAARSLRDQCKAAGVAFFMKQMQGARKAAMPPIPDDLMIREMPRLLDGIEHNGYPSK